MLLRCVTSTLCTQHTLQCLRSHQPTAWIGKSGSTKSLPYFSQPQRTKSPTWSFTPFGAAATCARLFDFIRSIHGLDVRPKTARNKASTPQPSTPLALDHVRAPGRILVSPWPKRSSTPFGRHGTLPLRRICLTHALHGVPLSSSCPIEINHPHHHSPCRCSTVFAGPSHTVGTHGTLRFCFSPTCVLPLLSVDAATGCVHHRPNTNAFHIPF